MKTRRFFLLAGLVFLGITSNVIAQVTQASNTPPAGSYIGTSAASTNTAGILFKRLGIDVGLLTPSIVCFGENSKNFDGISIGTNSGQYSTGIGCVFIGNNSGRGSTSALNSGTYNTFIGYSSGINNLTGSNNVLVGQSTEATGNDNVHIGPTSGGRSTGNNNTFLGKESGLRLIGSNNVMIGSGAGGGAANHNYDNKLFIDNSTTTTPLIWGDFALDQVKLNGKVGIGAVTTFPTVAGGVTLTNYKLFVTGGILTDEIRVSLSSSGTWADYVFNKDYNLKPLSEVEQFIKENGHLPNVPSAQKVKEEGIELGNMAKIQQEKIEELTLYLIQQNKEIAELKAQMQLLLNGK
jgi:hypothetical protein